jgi:hypothetical protein
MNMGEWSDYFEDFPEENPANWINGSFNPALRKQLNLENNQQKTLNSEIHDMIEKAKREQREKFLLLKEKSLLIVEGCPQCGLQELNTYEISENFYLCECQDCRIYGTGKTYHDALNNTSLAIGDGLDWQEIESINQIMLFK